MKLKLLLKLKSKTVSFASLIMKKISVSPSLSRFLLKLICCIAFGSASRFVFYSNLLQLSYHILWNMGNLVNNQLCNHHIDQLQFCKYYHMFLYYFLRLIKEISFIDHNIVTFYFYRWKKILGILGISRCFNVKSSTYCFHMKTKILADFQICISVPLIFKKYLMKMKEHWFKHINLYIICNFLQNDLKNFCFIVLWSNCFVFRL